MAAAEDSFISNFNKVSFLEIVEACHELVHALGVVGTASRIPGRAKVAIVARRRRRRKKRLLLRWRRLLMLLLLLRSDGTAVDIEVAAAAVKVLRTVGRRLRAGAEERRQSKHNEAAGATYGGGTAGN